MHQSHCLEAIAFNPIKNEQFLEGTCDAIGAEAAKPWVMKMPNPAEMRQV